MMKTLKEMTKDDVYEYFYPLKVMINFVLMFWELPRQIFMCIATPSGEWATIQDAKLYEEVRELCPETPEAFEITLKEEDFE